MPYADKVKLLEYQRKWNAARRNEWFSKNGPCVCCGSSKDLRLDHIDPDQKVSHKVWTWSKARREAELSKCQVLCEPCHKAKTLEDKRKQFTHCPSGHAYTEENTRIEKGTNSRKCRTCDRDYHRKRRGQLG